jgi:hypothetical protein
MLKSHFQTKNKTKLWNSTTRTHKLRIKTCDVQNKCENESSYVYMCKHEHEKNMSRLWCKIVPKTNVEQT